MKTIAASEIQARFDEVIDAVVRTGERITITRVPYTPGSDNSLEILKTSWLSQPVTSSSIVQVRI